MPKTPQIRIRSLNSVTISGPEDRRYVLYWMVANRRLNYNFSLQHAVELSLEHNCPLVILEALRLDYPWACPRFHRFVMDGMQVQLAGSSGRVTYLSYLEREHQQGKGLLQALADPQYCRAVVSDEFPCFFIPAMQKAAAEKLQVPFSVVDSNGILPMRAAPKAYDRAVDFRRFLQKELAPHFAFVPSEEPLKNYRGGLSPRLPDLSRWPMADAEILSSDKLLAKLSGPPIVENFPGGSQAAHKRLQVFLGSRLGHYSERRSDPAADEGYASGLSPYLHFGHISVHEILRSVAAVESWEPSFFTKKANGSKEGTWGMSGNAESFLDELVTWRELGYGFCYHHPTSFSDFDSLPAWAIRTLTEHSSDVRPWLYNLEQLDQGRTHDKVWNAAQRQLREAGIIQNYLRMLWGKKILEWSPSPRAALEVLIELNNRYALDGRNPNSYSGIFWCLGRFDRPWFEREIFGSIRYMSSDSTVKKFKMDGYLRRWGVT